MYLRFARLPSTSNLPVKSSLGLKLKIPARPTRPGPPLTSSTLAVCEVQVTTTAITSEIVPGAATTAKEANRDAPAGPTPIAAAAATQRAPSKPAPKKQLPLEAVLKGPTRMHKTVSVARICAD